MSQSQEILNLLKDGRWWSTAEIMREVPSIVHSRINDLRRQGRVIEHRTTGQGAQGSWYRWTLADTNPQAAYAYLRTLESPAVAVAAGTSSGSNLGFSSGSPDTPRPEDGSLVLEGQETLL